MGGDGRCGSVAGDRHAKTVRKLVRQVEVDVGRRPGTTTEESDERNRLRRGDAELNRANAILKAASTIFGAELERPHHSS